MGPSCGGSVSTLGDGVWLMPRSAEGLRRAILATRAKGVCHHMHHSTHTESALHPCSRTRVAHTHRATARVASLAHKPGRYVQRVASGAERRAAECSTARLSGTRTTAHSARTCTCVVRADVLFCSRLHLLPLYSKCA